MAYKFILLITLVCLIQQIACIQNTTDYYCNSVSKQNACKPCLTNADCGASQNDTEWYCWGQLDQRCTNHTLSGYCNALSLKNNCTTCTLEEDCGGVTGKTSFCWASKDQRCNSSYIAGYCNKESPKNNCQGCKTEEDCGGVVGNTTFCWEVKDQQCLSSSSFCAKDSPKNACKPCSKNTDCGAESDSQAPWYCWGQEDPQCNATQTESNNKTVELNKLNLLELSKAPKGFCNKKSPKNACQPCSYNYECGGVDNTTSYCWASRDITCSANNCMKNSTQNACFNCWDDKDCGGSSGEFTQCKQNYQCKAGDYYCSHNSTKNACEICLTNSDCGQSDDDQIWYCWGQKDILCPNSIKFLQN